MIPQNPHPLPPIIGIPKSPPPPRQPSSTCPPNPPNIYIRIYKYRHTHHTHNMQLCKRTHTDREERIDDMRERRQQQRLRLSLPQLIRVPECHRRSWATLPSSSSSSSNSLDSPDVDSLSDLEKTAVLGHGNGGTVYKVRNRRNAAVYALKVLRCIGEDPTAMRRQAAREAEIFTLVDSQFVVRCHGVFEKSNDPADAASASQCGGGDACSHLCFVMEYMENGSLDDVLRQRRRLPEPAISDYARRVLLGLRYLQGMLIVHGDIKPSNLLIDGSGDLKIADFGASRRVAVVEDGGVGGGGAVEDEEMGTCAYMSPERIDPEHWGGEVCDEFAGDVWSLGVVVLECYVGRFPLIGSGQRPDWATLMCAISFGVGERLDATEAAATASPEFRSFVGRCLERDWRKRGTVTELLNHPFLLID